MSLKKKAVAGAKWTTVSQVGSTALQLIQLGVLARLLDPADFGLMSMIMIVLGFANAYIDMGIGNAIIQRQDSTDDQLSSLYWLNLAAGFVVFIVVYLATPLIVDFYNEPRLSNLLIWASLTFVITPLGQQFQYLMQKELEFKTLAIITIGGALTGAITAITSAILGQGVYSLIWGQLANTGIRTIAFIYEGYKRWPPELHFKWDDLEGYLSFGMYQLGDKTLNYFTKNIDYILIGRYLGSEILGAYTIAFQLVIIPISKINPILTNVAFPLFSKRQDHNAPIRYGYLQMSKILAVIVYPLLIGLAVTAPVALPVFLGKGWELSITLTQILVFVGLVRTLGNPSGTIYLAKGRADIGFKFNLVTSIISATVFWIFVKDGAIAIALSFSILNILYYLANRYITNRMIDLTWGEYLAALYKQLFLSFGMGICVYIAYLVLSSLTGGPLLLGILVTTGAVVYLLATWLADKKFILEFYSLLRAKKEQVGSK